MIREQDNTGTQAVVKNPSQKTSERRPGLIYPTSSNIPAIDEKDAIEMMKEAAAPSLDNTLGA